MSPPIELHFISQIIFRLAAAKEVEMVFNNYRKSVNMINFVDF